MGESETPTLMASAVTLAMTKPPNAGGAISSKGGREAMRYVGSLGVLLVLCATGAFAQTNTIQGDYVESRSLNIFN